ncbi:hypothetical protein FNO01nite_08770 [Flavobacterium noncentrifugens]|uniref:DUF2752 domain-containing protein n=1 Tax=Flavobacterium noncentrifugens TaxID=1128970 RepID=A0A1G8TFN0_9FLAO|nr:DUF2752 domain-containing protein [Flavobacterium noncentrifugens]GEP50205.1 hypothetical protein FNO01nite_08770 [Flavobacterium noncentrifugens]SDJ40217.1 Protein of unknown function [Flavobacterium noncentrifugens]
MTKNKLYSILLIACFFGYAWLGFSILNEDPHGNSHFGVCFFKKITSFPCPSCGTTRSVKFLAKGEFSQALMTNPFGIIVAFLMIAIPVWIACDAILKTQTLFEYYHKTENLIRTRWIATLLILLVLGNWIWNINKGL